MKLMNLNLWLLLAFCLNGCSQDEPAEGSAGGACRLSATPCDESLICRAGKCTEDPSTVLPSLAVVIDLSERSLMADGESVIELQFLIDRAQDNAPYSGQLLLHTEPAAVGELSQSLLTVEDGFASATFTSCHRRTAISCPEVISFKLAAPERPNEPLFESEKIRLISEPIETPTGLQPDSCRSSIGSQIAITVADVQGERIETSEGNPWLATENRIVASTDSVSLMVPAPNQAVEQYQALSPNMVNVSIELATEDEASTLEDNSNCFQRGTWVGSQRLEFWSESPEEGTTEDHVLTVIELDCIDDRGNYHVVRACAHGTR